MVTKRGAELSHLARRQRVFDDAQVSTAFLLTSLFFLPVKPHMLYEILKFEFFLMQALLAPLGVSSLLTVKEKKQKDSEQPRDNTSTLAGEQLRGATTKPPLP